MGYWGVGHEVIGVTGVRSILSGSLESPVSIGSFGYFGVTKDPGVIEIPVRVTWVKVT